MGEQVNGALTKTAKLYALALVKRWKIEDEHADCVQAGFVVRMGATVGPDGSIIDRPFSVATNEIDHHTNCKLARIIQRNHCKHGTYVGDPYGPDYMCGFCEDGYDPNLYEMAIQEARTEQKAVTEKVIEEINQRVLDSLVSIHQQNDRTLEWVGPDVIARMMNGVMSAAS